MSNEFIPKNDENTLYIGCGSYGGWSHNFSDIIEQTKRHFGEEISLEELNISSEYIHTRCIGYDLYDPKDYDCYIIITRN